MSKSKFSYAVVRPVAGRPGERLYGYTGYFGSVSEGVKHVRSIADDPSLVVLQEAAYATSVVAYKEKLAAMGEAA